MNRFEPGRRVLVDGEREGIVVGVYPDGSRDHPHPHYRIRFMNEFENQSVTFPRVDAPKVTARPVRLGRPERRALRHCIEGTPLPRTEAMLIAMGNLARMGFVAPDECRTTWVATELGQRVYGDLEERRSE